MERPSCKVVNKAFYNNVRDALPVHIASRSPFTPSENPTSTAHKPRLSSLRITYLVPTYPALNEGTSGKYDHHTIIYYDVFISSPTCTCCTSRILHLKSGLGLCGETSVHGVHRTVAVNMNISSSATESLRKTLKLTPQVKTHNDECAPYSSGTVRVVNQYTNQLN